MYLLTIIPISRGIGKEYLTYYTTKDILPGALVTIPLRKREVPGLVVTVEDLSTAKAHVRKASFAMKKIIRVDVSQFFSKEFLETIHKSADYFATTSGALLHTLVPKQILENSTLLAPYKKTIPRKSTHSHTNYLIHTSNTKRFDTYTRLVQEWFTRKQSIIILVPTTLQAEQLHTHIRKNMNDGIFILHTRLSKKKLLETWSTALTIKMPICVIMTGGFLSLPRTDIGAFIIENEASPYYKLRTRPYLDIRAFTETYAETLGATMYFGDSLPRIETYYRKTKKEISPYKATLQESTHTIDIDIVDMTTKNDEPFSVFSKKAIANIQKAISESKPVFLYVTRRGLAPVTVCHDCGHTVTCEKCASPLVVHTSTKVKDTLFICHQCGHTHSTLTRCDRCKSWNLTMLGIGAERVEKEIARLFPETHRFLFTSDVITTPTQAKKVIKKWKKQSGILIGTQMVLPYLSDITSETSIVVSFDSLFALPDFRINESIMHLVHTLKTATATNILIQTRNSEQEILSYVSQSNVEEWYTNELEKRKMLKYPPYTTLIKLTFEGRKPHVEKQSKELKTYFAEYHPLIYSAFTAKKKSQHVMHLLLTLDTDNWIDETLLEKLRTMPLNIKIDVEPYSVI